MSEKVRIGVLTSGGDAQGMNAAVRAVVRTAIHFGAVPYAVMEGWQGAVDGGDRVRELTWDDVGSIQHRGGTIIGTARSNDFRERHGMLSAAEHLLEHGIDRLVVIGGDGSLTGTDEFRGLWPELLAELVEAGRVSAEVAAAHPALMVVGLVGSIDNDLIGLDMTIGADSALHRIVDAIDTLSSTAASHRRSFVIEVMGRRCGYLPLLAAIAGGCDYILIPEDPPAPGWEAEMCEVLRKGRAAGRRESLVIVAEGAMDSAGAPISADYVRSVIEERLEEDARVTILGHVQRGGTPSAYDRWMSTILGYQAVINLLHATADDAPQIVGVRHNRIVAIPLMDAVAATRAVGAKVKALDTADLVAARGSTFAHMHEVFHTMANPPRETVPADAKTIAVLNAGGLAPGMNSAVRVAVRLGVARGYRILGVQGSFKGLAEGNLTDLSWGDVDGWVGEGGAFLGTSRHTPGPEDLYAISRAIETNQIDALLIIGGFNAYEAAHRFVTEADRFPSLRIPLALLPATIDNNLPGAELSIGADTALNGAVEVLDKIKQSASANSRVFVAELMGRWCGYLTFMSGLATGAERVYLHEEGITLADLQHDVGRMQAAFHGGKKLFLALRNENANDLYSTDFLMRLFEEEGQDLFDVRQAVLGHMQQGGNPSPFDRILATRLVDRAIQQLCEQLASDDATGYYFGNVAGRVQHFPIAKMTEQMNMTLQRPIEQRWLVHRPVLDAVADPVLRRDVAEVEPPPREEL